MELVKVLESLLNSKEYGKAREEIMKPESLPAIQQDEMDLISKLCDIGLHEAEDEADIGACAEGLQHIVENSNPRLALVSILEQAESFMYSPKFTIILSQVKFLLTQEAGKRSKSLSWALELVSKHLKSFHTFPPELNKALCEGNEFLLLEQNPKIQSIVQFYKDVLSMYEPLVAEHVGVRDTIFAGAGTDGICEEVVKKSKVFRSNLMELLGVPLICFDLSWTSRRHLEERRVQNPAFQNKKPEDKAKIKTEGRLIAERIMKLISAVNLDSSYYMKWIDSHSKSKSKGSKSRSDSESESDGNGVLHVTPDEDEERIQNTSVANYLYLIYAEELSPDQMPMAYSPNYVFHTLLPLINALLHDKHQNFAVIQKGLALAQKLISDLSDPLPPNLVNHSPYTDFLDKLIQLMIFSEFNSIRKLGLRLFTAYFQAFDPSGKFMFLKRILNTVEHSGLVGYMIGQLKDCVMAALTETENTELRSQFLGENFIPMLVQICELKNGPTTDLMQVSDKIIGALNLLRFLLIRDGTKNESGIMDGMKRIEAEMLKPLRSALDLTKAHYQLRLKQLQDPNHVEPKIGDLEMVADLTVGGKEMNANDIPVEEQVGAMGDALATLDLMEGLMVRVNECYAMARSTSR